ncbi:MAG: NADH-ubiquinone oxidoreductase chain K, partial [uncultured Acidimicrobiales bacterium]
VPEPVPAAGRHPVLPGRLRGPGPQERGAGADVHRAHAQRGEHQPDRLRRLPRQRHRSGVLAVRHRHRRRRSRRGSGHRPAHLPQPGRHRPRRARADEGL